MTAARIIEAVGSLLWPLLVAVLLIRVIPHIPGVVADLRKAMRTRAFTVKVGGVDRHPAAIVRVTDARDVARVVTFARERSAPLAVRGGGHSMAAHSVIDGGVVLDLSAMKTLDIDVAGRAAWAGPRETQYATGALWKFAKLVGSARHGAVTHPGAQAERHVYMDQ